MTATVVECRSVINRDCGYEEVMDALITKITGIEHFKHHTGCSFINPIFEIQPYYFGKCLCSYDKQFQEHVTANPHKEDCFLLELNLLSEAFKKHPAYLNNNKLKAERANEERRLCIAHNIDYKDGKNLSNVCNCGVQAKFDLLNIKHEDGCPKIKPNFIFKNTSDQLKIFWYKTYFRDAYSTQAITLADFKTIIGACLSSV